METLQDVLAGENDSYDYAGHDLGEEMIEHPGEAREPGQREPVPEPDAEKQPQIVQMVGDLLFAVHAQIVQVFYLREIVIIYCGISGSKFYNILI